VSVAFTHQVGEGRHSAIIKATKPTDAAATTTTPPVSRTILPMASDSGCR
jgi:hypothetical protein